MTTEEEVTFLKQMSLLLRKSYILGGLTITFLTGASSAAGAWLGREKMQLQIETMDSVHTARIDEAMDEVKQQRLIIRALGVEICQRKLAEGPAGVAFIQQVGLDCEGLLNHPR